MGNERQASGLLGSISSLRARVARYHEQADHFTRLAEAEPVEKIRDQWKTLARDYAYLASSLEPQSYGGTPYPTSPAAGDDQAVGPEAPVRVRPDRLPRGLGASGTIAHPS